MKLATLLEGVETLERLAPDSLDIASVQCDSRKVRPGDLFVAVRGERDDGLHYLPQALERGAAAIVSELPGASAPAVAAGRWIRVEDARSALARLAAAAAGHPADTLAVHAVTGTNGKTTTCWLLRDMLRAAGRTPGLSTTVMCAYADREIASSRTTPDACEMQATLKAMLDAGCDSAVVEASSHGILQHRVGAMRLASAAFTNLSRDHLDYHRDFESYYRAKRGLFEQLAATNPGHGVAVVNGDDPYGRRLADEMAAAGLRVETFGFGPGNRWRAEEVAPDATGSDFLMITPEGRLPIRVRLLGRHNIANMLCAAAISAAAGGVPIDVVVRVLQDATPRWGRLEVVPTPLPATFFVDYAHTDDALGKVLAALREITRGRLICVFGCGGDRDRAKRPKMGAAAGTLADHSIVTSDNPRTEDPDAIIREIEAGFPPGASYEIEADRAAAIRRAIQISREGDVVLVAGKGHETYQEFASRTIPFDDREQLRTLAASADPKSQP
ncbi:MAG: UDP-N-acetylmuramoyl-L-alanyl-D-glutamate--2,6-diaminopimelate ligase [Kiritimatiellia bacterium]|jgi:UDP-N-acetylmuramoyl-L-alanyl-D-glutamate--2,6-diaminopimelate ligase